MTREIWAVAHPAHPTTVDWDSPMWGQSGSNVHESAWAADGTHDDETEDR